MISKIYWINDERVGDKVIGTMARPRGNDWLEDEIMYLKRYGVDCLVSLLEKTEEFELELEKEGEICSEYQVEFINFPIEDVSVPKNRAEFIDLVTLLTRKVRNKEKIVIHCRMGIGRSSVLAAAVLISLGLDENDTFSVISKYRKTEVPDTGEQKEWILGLADELKARVKI